MASDSCEIRKDKSSWVWTWLGSWINWSSHTMLRTAEKKILSYLKTSYRGGYIDIGSCVGESDKIWTISMNTESQKTPLVLLHGLVSAVGLWVLNLDSFAEHRPVYAIDILGFGRSSRPKFATEAMTVEKQIVASIEEWRREMNIKEMILLGHSMGGFLATSYAIAYPDRVKHLILADPWGFPEKPDNLGKRLPLWARSIAYVVQPMNPLFMVRAAGPFGQWLVEKVRPDIMKKFSTLIDDPQVVPHYIHQCNAQTPAGESAFHTMMSSFGWAKNPMIRRVPTLRQDIPITLLYGSRSWIREKSMEEIKLARMHSYINMRVITGAGHHVYADKPEIFNQYVNEACKFCDLNGTETLSQSGNPLIQSEATESEPEDIQEFDGNNNKYQK